MNLNAFTRFVFYAWMSFVLNQSLLAQTIPDREVAQIRIDGLRTVPLETIRRKLNYLPEVFEASHSSVDKQTYAYRVREAVARGMLASGFLDSRVERLDDPGQLTLKIHEGPQFRRGQIEVSGAAEEVNQWIAAQLQIASTAEKEDASPVWQPGKPADGTLFGSLHRRQAIQARLSEIGLQGSEAGIDFVRHDDTKSQHLRIELSAADASTDIPIPVAADDPAPASTESSAGNQPIAEGLDGELQRIHRQLFSTPATGLSVQCADESRTMEFTFGHSAVVAILQQQSHRRRFVLQGSEVTISMDDPPAAIRLPIPNASAVLYQQSSQESDKDTTIRIKIDGAFSTTRPDRGAKSGFMFTQMGWTEWFPPSFTERTDTAQGVTYTHGDHYLRLDHKQRLIELSGTDANGHRLTVQRASEETVANLVSEVSQAAEPIELLARDPNTDRQVALGDVFQNILKDDDKDVKFHIPPASGQNDLYGALILMMVDERMLVEPDSLIGRLSKLYALELSHNRRGLSDRIAAIEPEAMQGPLTSAVIADLWARQGAIERALSRYHHAQQLAIDPTAVQCDIRMLVDSSHLLGRVLENFDVKLWLLQSTQLAEPFADEQQAAMAQGLIESLPDASTKQDRRENIKRLLTFAYDWYGQAMLEQHLSARIYDLKVKQRRVAEKKKKKDEQKR